MNKTYFIDTYGCQMNVADSELVESLLRREGYAKAPQIDQADAIFVNTCAIREHAEEKVHSQLGRYDLIKQKKPDTIIGVLGCMAQSLKHDLLENRPYVDIILGPDSYRKLPELLNRKKVDTKSLVDTTLSRFEVYDVERMGSMPGYLLCADAINFAHFVLSLLLEDENGAGLCKVLLMKPLRQFMMDFLKLHF